MKSLKDAVVEAINEYNKYRSPEAKAKLIKIDESLFWNLRALSAKLAEYTTTLKTLFTSYRNLQT